MIIICFYGVFQVYTPVDADKSSLSAKSGVNPSFRITPSFFSLYILIRKASIEKK